MITEKILLTWIGNRDPFTHDKEKGPILSLLSKSEYDQIIVFYTAELADKVEMLGQEIIGSDRLKITKYKVGLSDPRDYSEIYLRLKELVPGIITDNKDYYVYLDPGTAQMKTAWVLLRISGLLPARLIQGTEPRFNKGVFRYDEIHIDKNSFPGLDLADEVNINHALEKFRKEKKELSDKFKDIIGEHPEIIKCFEQTASIAPYDEPVLITGESGTGKELFARKVHELSRRSENKLVVVNCAAIPESIFESELFGYKKGSFTGAHVDKKGYIEEADGGTLFLDEIAELPLLMQAKLLRVVQEKQFHRIGDPTEKSSDFRLVAATNRDLLIMVREGKFREDLYYRINIVNIKVPPLRKRRNDILLLMQEFLSIYNREYEMDKKLSQRIKEKMMSLSWPGNVRELENTIKRLLLISDTDIIDNPALLPETVMDSTDHYRQFAEYSEKDEKSDIDRYLQIIERDILENSLKNNGNIASKSARELGLNPHTLRARLKKLNLW